MSRCPAASWPLLGEDATATADVREGLEWIHGWQTQGVAVAMAFDGENCDRMGLQDGLTLFFGCFGMFWALHSCSCLETWPEGLAVFFATSSMGIFIYSRQFRERWPGVPAVLLHVIGWPTGRVEQWQQSSAGGASLSEVFQCHRSSAVLKWSGKPEPPTQHHMPKNLA